MSKLIKCLLGALLVVGFFMESPVMAADDSSPKLLGVKFRIIGVGSNDSGGSFLIFIDDATKNNTKCQRKNALMVPRAVPNFNEIVSLATAAMMAGKEILVWSGTEYYDGPCGSYSGGTAADTDAGSTARISRLDVIN